MKKIILAVTLGLSIGFLKAQTCDANDSTFMGTGSGNDVFYSLKTGKDNGSGTVKTVSNSNWHLAFSVRGTQFPDNPGIGVAIRVNSPNGENPQMGATGCVLAKIPGANFSNWHNLDTSGLFALPELTDPDSTWNISAFTKGYSFANAFNFIWGTYNQSNHKVSGTSVFVLYNKSQNWYKKIFINEVSFDTLWRFTIANIDNSDSNFVEINKNDYKNRNFVYYDVLNNTVIDREPDNRTWDLLWTRYKARVPFGQTVVPYTVSGVLQNLGVTVAQNNGKKCSEVWLANKKADYSSNISIIGYDWKTFTGSSYAITDTFVYFIRALDTAKYKMTMISFTGGSFSKTVFSFYEATLSLDKPEISTIGVYPNPASSIVNIDNAYQVESLQVYDVFGKLVSSNINDNSLDITNLSSGVYMLYVKTDKGVFQQKLIKE